MQYKITKGYDHHKQKPLFQVVGTDNEYVGEWSSDRNDIVKELANLADSYTIKVGGNDKYVPSVKHLQELGLIKDIFSDFKVGE